MENNTSKEFKHISRPKFKLLNRNEQIEYLKEFIIRFANVNCQLKKVEIKCGSEEVNFNDKHTEFTYYRNYKRICRYKGEDAKALDNALNVAIKKEEEWYNEWLNLISVRIKL